MNISIISTDDIDGGAAIAAYRLFKGLRSEAHNTSMIVKQKKSHDPNIFQVLVKAPQFDSEIKILCIDEPELALEPRLQKSLYRAIKAKSTEKKIIVATHSHHFLDRENVANNYVCSRNTDNKISLKQLTTQEDLRDQVFKLLGNELGDLQLPEKILIVEGVSDVEFVKKSLNLLGKNSYIPFGAGSDSRISTAIDAVTQFIEFVTTAGSVYKDRTWVVADKQVNDVKLREWRTKLGDDDKVKELPENGIEYFYPERILQKIFKTPDTKDIIIDEFLKGGKYNGLPYSKLELSRLVADELMANDLASPDNELFVFLGGLLE